MITATTRRPPRAIAGQLGIEGGRCRAPSSPRSATTELDAQVDGIGVVARVAPEDKVRLVDMLKRRATSSR
jgi:Ca2+-transporting ATPase